ncbi:MAG: HK97 gp10 family phage protein [Lachnospiraceae bacterium]|nr:HK97 gp10 family phage protein [Lachnospiraceae bacterium]
MTTKKVSIDEMADAINQGLQEYADLAAEEMKTAVKKTATAVKKEISANAPVKTGTYAKSWTTKKTAEDSQSLQMTVYSKNRYQLAHLLEKGHANRGGGRTKAYPHIALAEETGAETLQQLIETALKG